MPDYADGLPIEEFIQALSSQLDRAQAALALKAKFGLPLTFAVKDIAIDLRAYVGLSESQVLITPVGPGDPGGSIIRLALTTITRPMIQENTLDIKSDEPPLHEVLGDEITEEEQRRLEWAGIRSVEQLRELERQSGEHVIEQVAQIPAMRLRAALQRASRPRLDSIRHEGAQLHIKGRNLLRDAQPNVHIGGRPARILSVSERELIVEPPPGFSGTLAVETAPGLVAEAELPPAESEPSVPGENGREGHREQAA